VNASDVGSQIASVGIGNVRASHLTPERFLAKVDVHMLLEVGSLQETLDRLAYVTFEWLVLAFGMGALDVSLHLSFGNHQAALMATDFCVRSVVVVERCNVREGFLTLVTLMDFHTMVGLVMEGHVRLGNSLRTDWADYSFAWVQF